MLCRVMQVQRSGYYAWRAQPLSQRGQDDRRLLGLIKQSWLESGTVYGYRKITSDLRDLGEQVGKNRVFRLMRSEQLQAQRGYDRRPRHHAGKSANVAPNHLQQAFTVDAPNKVWVTDITYIRTHEGWLYLAAVMDLFSRQVVGWSMGARMETELVLNALLMAVWRRRPTAAVMIHSDQGSQFSSHDWQTFLKVHNLVPSMSRRGNCWDNAVAESFFQLLKRERIRRKVYLTRDEAREDVFDYVEMFYNRKRKHGHTNMLPPAEFERQYFMRQGAV